MAEEVPVVEEAPVAEEAPVVEEVPVAVARKRSAVALRPWPRQRASG